MLDMCLPPSYLQKACDTEDALKVNSPSYSPAVPRTCTWDKRAWYNFLLGTCHPHTKTASGFAICMAISRPPWPYKDTAWLTCQGTCAMQMAMRDTKNLTLQEAVKCPVDIGFVVDAFVQNNVYRSKSYSQVIIWSDQHALYKRGVERVSTRMCE